MFSQPSYVGFAMQLSAFAWAHAKYTVLGIIVQEIGAMMRQDEVLPSENEQGS